ncbi:ankyrin domain protein (macronuclear) [Tetrahymena thermophila SB210]|uniref:Ankyrin domain protein n=1 Tax=Tetrahymena thermophila (strain SB210) TaxID=312017 RepID=Q22CW3_TETTS|nr:ankyrin domain protein [Tetrahymena thermophila SB210]EAR83156.1 ankyrin domain protein [Tetrahymena thermophila SB210]|eukprot:XP_001030819.1 ankyrin domain protein [Tetrahymena thermophila SB210]
MIQRFTQSFKDSLKHYWSVYKTDQILRIYNKEKYDKIPTKLKTFKQYEYIKINEYGLLFLMISEQNKVAIEKLLSKINYKEKVLNDTSNPSKLSPTTFAILNNITDMSLFLQQFGANIFAPNEDGNTLLHIAAFYRNLEAVKFALENNSDVNACNKDGDTPLFYAIVKQSPEIIEYFLSKGANDLVKNNNGLYPIHEATVTGNIEIIKLFEKTLTQVRNSKPDLDPIHLAAQLESTDVLDYLLEKNPSFVNLPDNSNQQTPLHYAVIEKKYECARYLLLKGAKPNIQDKFGNTPLHFATLNKDLDMCYILDDYGSDARIKNKDGLNCIDLCFVDRDQTMVNYFKGLNKYSKVFLETYQ